MSLPDKPEKKIRLNPRQRQFIKNWLDPNSKTFGNVYKSGIEAGFKPSYARQLLSDSWNIPWVQEAKREMASFEPEHIYRGFQEVATNAKQDRDKLKALELMGKARGMFIDRVQQDVHVKFVNDVPRPESERKIVEGEEIERN